MGVEILCPKVDCTVIYKAQHIPLFSSFLLYFNSSLSFYSNLICSSVNMQTTTVALVQVTLSLNRRHRLLPIPWRETFPEETSSRNKWPVNVNHVIHPSFARDGMESKCPLRKDMKVAARFTITLSGQTMKTKSNVATQERNWCEGIHPISTICIGREFKCKCLSSLCQHWRWENLSIVVEVHI